jgi:nucleoside-diphosphate-sugar epimerase
MAVLITGGAGYIGRWVARELLAREIETVAFDRIAPDPKSTLPLPAGAQFIEGDVTDRGAVLKAAQSRQFEAIIHLAGIVTMGAERDPDLAMRVNLDGTRYALDAARLCNIPKLVFASTISVYGPDVPQPIVESAHAEPLTWYGESKVLAEQLGLYYQRRWGLDFRAARLAAIVGPHRVAASGSATMYTSLILERSALGLAYDIDVDEEAATPICYAKDAARALVTLATADKAPRRIYNIGTARATAIGLLEIAKRKYPDTKVRFKPAPDMAAVGRISWNWELNIKAAEEDLGWK